MLMKILRPEDLPIPFATGEDPTAGSDGRATVRVDVVVESMREMLPASGDRAAFRDLSDRLHGTADRGARHFILDLTGVSYLDSAALGLFVGLLRHVRDGGGTVRIAGPSPAARRALELTCLSHIFSITDTVPEALDALPPMDQETS